MDSFPKQPSEIYAFDVEFSNRLVEGETITEKFVTAELDGEDATSDVISTSIINGTKITLKVKDGVSRNEYKITVKVNTSDSNTHEKDVLMRVRNI